MILPKSVNSRNASVSVLPFNKDTMKDLKHRNCRATNSSSTGCRKPVHLGSVVRCGKCTSLYILVGYCDKPQEHMEAGWSNESCVEMAPVVFSCTRCNNTINSADTKPVFNVLKMNKSEQNKRDRPVYVPLKSIF